MMGMTQPFEGGAIRELGGSLEKRDRRTGFVFAGLVPAVHAVRRRLISQDFDPFPGVDGRDKPAGDGTGPFSSAASAHRLRPACVDDRPRDPTVIR